MSQPQGPGGGAPAPKQAGIVKYKSELRKAIRRNAHDPEINFLNITAMLDIMTIILVFLLKTLGESSAAVPQSDDLRLPTSVMKKAPAKRSGGISLAARVRPANNLVPSSWAEVPEVTLTTRVSVLGRAAIRD